jgi:hypothetical protein
MPWAEQVFTDAAGGSLERLGAGIGGVCGDWWFYIPWPRTINASGWRIDGKKVGRKLSALELIGPLVAVVAGHRIFANKHVTVWVDNAGSVAIWRKGYSTRCRLSSTIVTTIHAVATAIGCTLHIQKIRRCSNALAAAADALSKAQFQAARGFTPLRTEPAAVPRTLLRWVNAPNPSDDLAHLILSEISKTMQPGLELFCIKQHHRVERKRDFVMVIVNFMFTICIVFAMFSQNPYTPGRGRIKDCFNTQAYFV